MSAAVPGRPQEQSPLSRPATVGAAGRHSGFDSLSPAGPANTPAVYLAGRVVLQDGSDPPEPALIERHCDGKLFSDAFTDSRGRFSFRPGGDATMSIVTGNAGGFNHLGRDPVGGSITAGDRSLGQINLTGCYLTASLGGYASTRIPLGKRSAFENPNVGQLVLTPIGGRREMWVSATSLRAPRKARKLYEEARRLLARSDPDLETIRAKLLRAVESYESYAAAWTLLGRMEMRLGRPAEAETAIESAIAADPQHVPAYLALADVRVANGEWDELLDAVQPVLERLPHLAQANYAHALASLQLNRWSDAARGLVEVLRGEQADRYPAARQLLAGAYAQLGNYPAAAAQLRTYLATSPDGRFAGQARQFLEAWEREGLIAAVPAGGQEP